MKLHVFKYAHQKVCGGVTEARLAELNLGTSSLYVPPYLGVCVNIFKIKGLKRRFIVATATDLCVVPITQCLLIFQFYLHTGEPPTSPAPQFPRAQAETMTSVSHDQHYTERKRHLPRHLSLLVPS